MNGIEKFDKLKYKLVPRETLIRIKFKEPEGEEGDRYGLWLGYEDTMKDLNYLVGLDSKGGELHNSTKRDSIIDFDIMNIGQIITMVNETIKLIKQQTIF